MAAKNSYGARTGNGSGFSTNLPVFHKIQGFSGKGAPLNPVMAVQSIFRKPRSNRHHRIGV